MIIKDKDYEEICVMMYSMQTLHSRGISLSDTLNKSLQNLLLWYQNSEDGQYLEIMYLQLQAYVNMGNALNMENESIQKALELLGLQTTDFCPKGFFLGKQIRLNPSQVRSMIGKWRPSKSNPTTIQDVVEDIIEKVKQHQVGHYFYKYHRFSDNNACVPDVYELIIEEDESYFYDINNFKFYKFV